MATQEKGHGNGSGCNRTALLLQGGGALGAYHHGIYEALAEGGIEFDWFAGTSIGAIQAAILAGNPPEHRLEQLEAFWERITWPQWVPVPGPEDPMRKATNIGSALWTMVLGQPGFFQPRVPMPWDFLVQHNPDVSLYDVSLLEDTLKKVIDFDYLNSGHTRLSMGAVNVESGEHVFFDNHRQTISARHVMASGALPPAFPSIEIEGCRYWDGGVLSNRPLDIVLNEHPRRSTLCFMVDLFDPEGWRPGNLDELEDRRKDVIYASSSTAQIDSHRMVHNLRHALYEFYRRLPDSEKQDPVVQALAEECCTSEIKIVHFIYRGQAYRSWAKDFTFLRQTLEDHRGSGRHDGNLILRARPWTASLPPQTGVAIYEVDNLSGTANARGDISETRSAE
ncbi:patatin-like phospholipase family protein [Halomonas sp.]|uniref:patatin-like phospholipase family protein n=1 Tax=Halomonas sp. TaxID=1486246 RepID=UPI00298DB2AE|nr:patatin-like phospholipase family protein [Halomonas sp.]MDW7745998.1 patatin-like phospholipase family protein [Halomonas sp.]